MKQQYEHFQYCPCCGTQFEAADFKTSETMYQCRGCGFEFYQNSKPSAAMVVPLLGHESKVLLIKRSNQPNIGKWALPGGFLGYGEAPERGAVREAKEETGLDVEAAGVLGSWLVDYTYQRAKLWVLEVTYLAVPVDADGPLQATEESAEISFHEVGEVLNDRGRLAFPEQAQPLQRYVELSKSNSSWR